MNPITEIVACCVFVGGIIFSILHGIVNDLFEIEMFATFGVVMGIILLFH